MEAFKGGMGQKLIYLDFEQPHLTFGEKNKKKSILMFFVICPELYLYQK